MKYFLKLMGYQVCKIPSLKNDIKAGKYEWLQSMGIKTVLDVGANIGKFSNLISKILLNVNIYAYEPLSSCYYELVKNTKYLESIRCFNFGLGERSEEVMIYHNEFSPSSSILKMKLLHKEIFPRTINTHCENIQIRKFDELVDEILLVPKVLMKIDVQGFELHVLKGALSSLNKIDIIIVETSYVDLYENQPLFNDVYNFLIEKNYSYHGNFDQIKNPKTGRILQADAIFIKN